MFLGFTFVSRGSWSQPKLIYKEGFMKALIYIVAVATFSILGAHSALAQGFDNRFDQRGCGTQLVRYCTIDTGMGGGSTACGQFYRVVSHIMDSNGKEIRSSELAINVCLDQANQIAATSPGCF